MVKLIASQGSLMDWRALWDAAVTGGDFMGMLAKLPRECWNERDSSGNSLLHYACCASHAAATVVLVQSNLVDVNARNKYGGTPLDWVVSWNRHRMVELMCALGADLRAQSEFGRSPLECALQHLDMGCESVRVLIANGARLSTVRGSYQYYITPELEVFERAVLRCRAAVVALLRVKRVGELWRWDKFLLRELAYAVWATRTEDEWQT